MGSVVKMSYPMVACVARQQVPAPPGQKAEASSLRRALGSGQEQGQPKK